MKMNLYWIEADAKRLDDPARVATVSEVIYAVDMENAIHLFYRHNDHREFVEDHVWAALLETGVERKRQGRASQDVAWEYQRMKDIVATYKRETKETDGD